MQGVAAVLLSLEKVPVIRYQGFSELARRLAERVNVINRSQKLFLHLHFNKKNPLYNFRT